MLIRNAITVCSVMAFSLAASIVIAAEPEATPDPDDTMQFGEVTPCADRDSGNKMLRTSGTSKLLAAYAEEGYNASWVRILQQGKKFTLEVATPRVKRRNINPALAQRISARLADDIAQNAFVFSTNEIQLDGIWYAYTADGKSCANMAMIHRNDRAAEWTKVFSTLANEGAKADSLAWFWMDQRDRKPATLTTSLASLNADQPVIGAGSSWNFPGVEPLSIVNHRASVDDDKIEIIGELQNNRDIALDHSDVYATFYDANGAVLLEDDALVAMSLLPSGTRSPFSISVPAQGVVAYTLRIEPGEETKVNPPTLRVTEHHSRDDEEDLIVSGTIRNEGKTEEQLVEVYVNFYDDAGRLLLSDSDFVAAANSLPAGSSGTFEVFEERPPGFHHYEVVIDPGYRENRD